MDWVKTETGQKVEDGSVVVVMVVMSVMAVPGVFESQENSTVLLSTVEDPKPHGGSEQLGAPSVLECGLMWVKSRYGSIPS